jgi:hypothetical protein
MSKKAIAAIIGACWVISGILNAGFLNAHLRKELAERCNSREAASQQAFALGYGLFTGPLGLVYTLLFTSLAHEGWTLSRSQHCGPAG